MGNNYKQIGPFVYGDPRFLAGGATSATVTYTDNRTSVYSSPVVPPDVPSDSAFNSLKNLGQVISYGKSGYHGNRVTNLFVKESDLTMPTVGVEVETIMRDCTADSARKFTRFIYSNWFHAENDGSLDGRHGGTYGYELVTTVMPARIYRDISVWTGFQNLISPLLYSYSSNETGLHVHVGMSYFENTKFPAINSDMLTLFGKILTTKIYYSFLPRPLAQRVFLRNSDLHYCHETTNSELTRPISPLSGYALIDSILDNLLSQESEISSNWLEETCRLVRTNNDSDSILPALNRLGSNISSNILNYGHNSEINATPALTLEFRRGKGTTNALSIHRMIELCVMTVMYAGHVIDNPEEIVSTNGLIRFIIDNTSSQALRALAEKELENQR